MSLTPEETWSGSDNRRPAQRSIDDPGSMIAKAGRSHLCDALEAFRLWASASKKPSLDLPAWCRERWLTSVVGFRRSSHAEMIAADISDARYTIASCMLYRAGKRALRPPNHREWCMMLRLCTPRVYAFRPWDKSTRPHFALPLGQVLASAFLPCTRVQIEFLLLACN